MQLTEILNGNFWVLVNVKGWVKELTWLLIGCVKTKIQSGAKLVLWPNYLLDYKSKVSAPGETVDASFSRCCWTDGRWQWICPNPSQTLKQKTPYSSTSLEGLNQDPTISKKKLAQYYLSLKQYMDCELCTSRLRIWVNLKVCRKACMILKIWRTFE